MILELAKGVVETVILSAQDDALALATFKFAV